VRRVRSDCPIYNGAPATALQPVTGVRGRRKGPYSVDRRRRSVEISRTQGEDTPARKMQHQWRMSMALTTKALLVAGGIVILVVALVVGVGIKLFDLSGRREDEAERLQDRMTERLRRAVGEVPLTVVAHASASAREPVVIEIAGPVATMEARERVFRQEGASG
jgi:hypothetical protein